jgi:hypothetical protein
MINASWHERHPMPKNPSLAQRVAWHFAYEKQCRCRPMPAKLRQWIGANAKARSRSGALRAVRPARSELRSLLSGGDRRSVARSEQARALLESDPTCVAEVARLATDRDWLVSMRAMDLLEKLVHEHADWVEPHKKLFIGPLADSDKWELRLQVVRALPCLDWNARELKRVVEILVRDVEHPQKFVRAWALDSLATLAKSDPALRPLVERHIAAFECSASKALQTRARKLARADPSVRASNESRVCVARPSGPVPADVRDLEMRATELVRTEARTGLHAGNRLNRLPKGVLQGRPCAVDR